MSDCSTFFTHCKFSEFYKRLFYYIYNQKKKSLRFMKLRECSRQAAFQSFLKFQNFTLLTKIPSLNSVSSPDLRRQVWGEVLFPAWEDRGKCLVTRAPQRPEEGFSPGPSRIQALGGRGHPPGRGFQVVLPEEILLIAEQLQLLHQVLHHHKHVVGRAGPPLHDHLPRSFAAGPRHLILQTRQGDHGGGGCHHGTERKSPARAATQRPLRPALAQPGPARPVTQATRAHQQQEN